MRRKLSFHILGKGLSALILFASTPFYLKAAGIESYGVIALFYSLLGLSVLFDFGLSAALCRALAEQSLPVRSLVRTMEPIVWGTALVLSLLASFFMSHLTFMGFAVALQAPSLLYSNGLAGLQRQLQLNLLSTLTLFVRNAGGILLLFFIEPSLELFFIWQTGVSIVQSLLFRTALWKALPTQETKTLFDFKLLRSLWRFAAGMNGISLTGLILTQCDKIVLSHLLAPVTFGIYCAASYIATALSTFCASIASVYFPHFAQLLANRDEKKLLHDYHRGCRFMSLFVLPVGLFIIIFAHEILLFWTRDRLIADNGALMLSLLMIGSIIYGLISIPYALQVAYGKTKLFFYQNLVGVLFLFPLSMAFVSYHARIGAVLTWLSLNLVYLFVGLPRAQQLLSKEEQKRWWLEDVGPSFILATMIPFLIKGLIF